MANRPKCHLPQSLLFLLSYTVAIVAASTSQTYNQRYSPAVPNPHDFPNDNLYQAYLVIQRFKKTITCDPMKITSTWTGRDICGETTYVGFYCTTLPGQGKNLTVTSAAFDGFGLCAPKLQGFMDQLPDLALFQAISNKFGAIGALNLVGLSYHYRMGISDDLLQPLRRPPPTPNLALPFMCPLLGSKLVCGAASLGPIGTNSVSLEATAAGGTNARVLFLNNNELSGSLPAGLGFSKLSYLAVANNKLTGPIPPSIGHLQDSLRVLLLNNNQLSGCLPHELGMLTKAAVIDAGLNQLTGPIPSSFSCLGSVELLNLAGNRLYGEVPDALCKLAGPTGRLANLTLSGNYFTSVGPACAALIKDGVLDVKNNCIPGIANQRRPAKCAAFQSQPKACPAASTNQVTCPAASA